MTAVCVHVLFEIFVHVFEYEHELVFGVNDIVEADYVVVLEFFHEGNLADSGRWSSFFRVEVDFLEGDRIPRRSFLAFEYRGICTIKNVSELR